MSSPTDAELKLEKTLIASTRARQIIDDELFQQAVREVDKQLDEVILRGGEDVDEAILQRRALRKLLNRLRSYMETGRLELETARVRAKDSGFDSTTQ